MSAQTVQHQPLFTLALLLSLIEYYPIPHAGEGKETETKDHVMLKTKKFIFLHSAGCGMSYSFTAGEAVSSAVIATGEHISTILGNTSVNQCILPPFSGLTISDVFSL